MIQSAFSQDPYSMAGIDPSLMQFFQKRKPINIPMTTVERVAPPPSAYSDSPMSAFAYDSSNTETPDTVGSNAVRSAFVGDQPVAITNPVITPDGSIHVNDQHVNGKMYNSYTGLSGNKAFRNNNPGNLSGMSGLGYGASKIMHSNHGDKGDQKQLAFKDAASGWRGMNTLMSQKNYNNAPIRSAFAKYQSDQKAWGNMLSSMEKKGINTGGTFNQLSPDQKIIFMNDRARHEGWTGAPLTKDVLYGGK